MSLSERFDVIVVGGGSAGFAAAVSAAELGAHTLLLERGASLGGNVAHAFVHTICGLYHAADEGEVRILNPGMASRLAAGLGAAELAGAPERAGRVYVLPISPPHYATFLAQVCERTPGLEVRTESELVAVQENHAGEPHWTLHVQGRKGQVSEISADLLVDTSGDANAAALARAAVEEPIPEEIQLPSFIFRMGGVDGSDSVGFAKLRLTHAVAGAVLHGDLPAGCESVLVRPGLKADEVYITLNLPRPTETCYAPLNEASLKTLTERAREDAERISKFLCKTRPAYEKSRITASPERVGVRESRHVLGLRKLQGKDVLSGQLDPDEIALSSWPVELWHDHRRAHFEYPEGHCSIPLGSLISRSHPYLGMAGRCLSASHEALGALRVIGTALATGEAIGVAAALAADARRPLDTIAPSEVRRNIAERADREIAL